MDETLLAELIRYLDESIDEAEWARDEGVEPELQRGRIDAYRRVREQALYLAYKTYTENQPV